MAKDPAVLLYIDKWLTATKGMKAYAKGWYLNLILFQYDMGDLPNDIEELANLCDVRISEYDLFKQVFEQVLKQKFEENENGRLENGFAREILQSRKQFKEKRSLSGKISYVVRFAIKHLKVNKGQIDYLKRELDLSDLDLKNEQVLKQVLKQKLELYININEDVIINKDINKREENFKLKVFGFKDKYSDIILNEFFNHWSQHGENDRKMLFEKKDSFEISKRLVTWFNNSKKFSSGNKPKTHINHDTDY